MILQYGYNTTFEFEYNGNVIKKTMKTRIRFTVGNEYEALYLPDGSKNCIKVEGEGAHIDKGVGLIFITGALAFMFLGVGIFAKIEGEILLGGFALFSILLLLETGLYNVLNNRKQTKNYRSENEKLYNKNIDRKSDPSLIRYYPNTESTEKRTNNGEFRISNISGARLFILISIFIIFIGGTMVRSSYIPYSDNMNKIKNYEEGVATIKMIFKEEGVYKSGTSRTKYEKNTIVYEYDVNGKKYIATYTPSNQAKSHKKGETDKVYYNKNNPEECILNIENHDFILSIMFGGMIMVSGMVVFVYFIKKYIKLKRRQIKL